MNIGKIPLTSAELVKALFLSNYGKKNIDREKQEEIALQWDNIEKELQGDALWYFLTNRTNTRYQTRIDLVLDLVSEKTADDDREKYFTFFKIDEKMNEPGMTPDDLWRQIQQAFMIVKDWFENHELYHKIGYLIASGKMTLLEIFKIAKEKTKSDFIVELDTFIRDNVLYIFVQ